MNEATDDRKFSAIQFELTQSKLFLLLSCFFLFQRVKWVMMRVYEIGTRMGVHLQFDRSSRSNNNNLFVTFTEQNAPNTKYTNLLSVE